MTTFPIPLNRVDSDLGPLRPSQTTGVNSGLQLLPQKTMTDYGLSNNNQWRKKANGTNIWPGLGLQQKDYGNFSQQIKNNLETYLHPDAASYRMRIAIGKQMALNQLTRVVRGTMEGRTIRFWFQLENTPDGSPDGDRFYPLVSLLPTRSSPAVHGALGDASSQNSFALFYDAKLQHIVTALAGPTIPAQQTTSASPFFRTNESIGGSHPVDDISEDSYWDENSLGNVFDPLTSRLAEDHPRQELGAPLPSLAGSRLEHHYFAKEGLKAERWYQLTLVINDVTPGGIYMLLDGRGGRMNQYLPEKIGDSNNPPQTGDQTTIPAYYLRDELTGMSNREIL